MQRTKLIREQLTRRVARAVLKVGALSACLAGLSVGCGHQQNETYAPNPPAAEIMPYQNDGRPNPGSGSRGTGGGIQSGGGGGSTQDFGSGSR